MDVMLDIETLGTAPGCVVLTVGACTMERDPKKRSTFEAELDWREQMGRLTVDPDTLRWWLEQDQTARARAFLDAHQVSVEKFHRLFHDWWVGVHAERVWCHGASFDAPILEAVTPMPWRFWNVRDTRTLYALAGVRPVRGADHHKALADAMSQTDAVWRALDKLGLVNLPTN